MAFLPTTATAQSHERTSTTCETSGFGVDVPKATEYLPLSSPEVISSRVFATSTLRFGQTTNSKLTHSQAETFLNSKRLVRALIPRVGSRSLEYFRGHER